MSDAGLPRSAAAIKRTFDIAGALLGLILTGWLIGAAIIIARLDTGLPGLFRQTRIGRGGMPFSVLKIRTMKPETGIDTSVTTARDPRITSVGRIFRWTRIDELPQLINVLVGDMSFVGPRPDVPGFADRLEGIDRAILSVRPGITGPATLYFRDEEAILARQADPERYNREVIFPEKVRLNRAYVADCGFWSDIRYLILTLVGGQR